VPFLIRQIKEELFHANSVTSAIIKETGHGQRTCSNQFPLMSPLESFVKAVNK